MSSRKRSMTLELGALLAVFAALVFSAVGLYLDRALAIQLRERDDADLVDRMHYVRHLLEETAEPASIRAEPHRFQDAVGIGHGLFLAIQSEAGEILTQNTAEHPLPKASRPVPPRQSVQLSDTEEVRLDTGMRQRVLTAWAPVGPSGKAVLVTLAHTNEDREAVLSSYWRQVLAAGISGAVLTAAFGFALVRRGLRPVRLLAAQARQVSAHSLSRRLDVAGAPQELQEFASVFNELLDRLQRSFDNLSQFAGDLAHDLRTPLNNLMVQTEVVVSQDRSVEEYQDLLTSNYEEFGRLARMVESMLFLARADHDQIALSTERLDAATELARIAEYFEGPASEAGVSFNISASGSIVADAHLFRRAVSNLVANALRYTPQGGVIHLSVTAPAGGRSVVVANPGPGIPREHLPRLFDRFYRTDPARSSQSQSAGLGLSIVRSIMTLHGGSADVASTEGEVTAFSLFFPDPGKA